MLEAKGRSAGEHQGVRFRETGNQRQRDGSFVENRREGTSGKKEVQCIRDEVLEEQNEGGGPDLGGVCPGIMVTEATVAETTDREGRRRVGRRKRELRNKNGITFASHLRCTCHCAERPTRISPRLTLTARSKQGKRVFDGFLGRSRGSDWLPTVWRARRPKDVDRCLHSRRGGGEDRPGMVARVQRLPYMRTEQGQLGSSQMLA